MWYARDDKGLKVFIYAQPNAKLTEIAGLYDGALKIRLNVPPIDGRANEALQKYLAQLFDVAYKQVKLVRGDKSRRKVFEIIGSLVDPETLFHH